MASEVLGIHQNKGMNLSTSQIWGSSVFSKASSFCLVTEEAALVNVRGKLEHRADWQPIEGICHHQYNMERVYRVRMEKGR